MKLKSFLFFFIALAGGWIMIACSGSEKTASSTIESPDTRVRSTKDSDRPVPMYSSYIGSDFKAQGNEPFWTLTIDFDRGIQLNRLGEDEPVLTPFPERGYDERNRELILDAKTEAHRLVIRIKEENCQDTMADESYPYTVTIELDGETKLQGCGHLMDETMELKSNWVLTEFPGVDLSTAPKIPQLSMDRLMSTYSATDGCNGIGGDLSIYVDEPLFIPGFSTEMYCGNDFDTQFKKVFLTVDDYAIRGEELLLKKEGEVVLRYKQSAEGLGDAERNLRDVWSVYMIGTSPIPKGAEAPRVEFHPAEGRINGYTGCNHFNGGMEADGSSLSVTEPLAMTKRYCQSSVEDAFVKNLSGVVSYKRNGNELFLYDSDGTAVLSLQKTD